MAEIILLWNVHPNEGKVTSEIAIRLKALLESQKEHKVDLREFPKKHTLQEKIKKLNNLNSVDKLEEKAYNAYLRQLKKKFPNAFIFALHTTPDRVFKYLVKPKRWKARIEPPHNERDEAVRYPITAMNTSHESGIDRVYEIEMPAKYLSTGENGKSYEKVRATFLKHYFSEAASLEETIKAGYLSEPVMRKLRHLIDTEVNTRLGHFKSPRAEPFMRKGAKRKRILPLPRKIMK